MAKRTNKNICLYCYGDLNPERICLNCQKKADDTPSPLHHYPQRTFLKDKDGEDRYLMGKALGEGGFGITYWAWDVKDGTKVAIKEYFPSGYVTRIAKNNSVVINSKSLTAASNRGMRRFVDEAKVLVSLKSLVGVVTVRDHFCANGTAYIVMEYLDGVSLKVYLKRRGGQLPPQEALRILRPVMDSLALVHQAGLVHRDISPDNIIITKTGAVKLIDFGAAKYNNSEGKSISIVLKQGFAPEEQYRTHGELGPWTDIYAMAVTIYFTITGQLPPESIQRSYRDTLIRPKEYCHDLSDQQDTALVKALSVYSKNRFQTMEKFIDALFGKGSSNYINPEGSTAALPKEPREDPRIYSRSFTLPASKPAAKKTSKSNKKKGASPENLTTIEKEIKAMKSSDGLLIKAIDVTKNSTAPKVFTPANNSATAKIKGKPRELKTVELPSSSAVDKKMAAMQAALQEKRTMKKQD